jgi:alpha-L-fucosidase
MNRREFVRSAAALSVLGLRGAADARAKGGSALAPAQRKTADLAHFERMPIGVSFHFSMNTFTGNDYDEGTAPATAYAPSALNVDQWISTAALIGARFAILTAKHMSGFCLWDADDYAYDVAASGNRQDVCAAFVAACKKRHIMPGFYYCILDPRNEGNQGHVDWAGRVKDSYYALILRQLTELHRKYKGAGLQVIDIPGKLSPEQRWEIYRRVRGINPHCLMMVNQTWTTSQANHGRISTPEAWPTDIMVSEDALPPKEGHDPWVMYEGTRYYMPMASWIPTGPFYQGSKYRTWFWNPQFKTRPASELFDIYQKTVSRKASMTLNLSPDTRGLLPDEAVEQMHRLAELIGKSS